MDEPSPKRAAGGTCPDRVGSPRGVPIGLARSSSAFTLIELLVVMVIIAVLISAVVAASTTLVTKAKISGTRAVLTIVRDAVEQFHREQTAQPTLARNEAYQARYGYYPPDELEIFTPSGIPDGPAGSRAVGAAVIVPTPPPSGAYPHMKFYTRGLPPHQAALEHRDLVAMVVAIQTLGDASASILERVQDRYWISPPTDPAKNPPAPILFLDRDKNGNWDRTEDLQLRYIVDDWGTPITYFAQRNWCPDCSPEPSSNHERWNEVSTMMIRLNGGQPVIMSYGPNGKEQLTKEAMEASDNEQGASLVDDWVFKDDHRINHHLNADNVYVDSTLKEKLARGIP